MLRIGERLQEVCRQIPACDCIADIGCDHGRLALYLAQTRQVRVIAADISHTCLRKARALADKLQIDTVEFRHGDGLSVLSPGQAQVAIFAGMGGETIVEILSRHLDTARSFDRMVLQPMGGRRRLRKWLLEEDFCVIQEGYAMQDKRRYSIFSVRAGKQPLERYDTIIGDWQLGSEHPLFGDWVAYQINRRNKVLSSLKPDTPKAQRVRAELQQIQEGIQWLQLHK